MLEDLGINHLDLRGVEETNVLNFSDEQVERIEAALDERGIGVISIGSPIGKIDITDDFEPHLERFETALEMAERYPDGTPHTTPLWVDHDEGQAVLLNTLRGRQKERNIAQSPDVSVSIVDPDNPYRYVTVAGTAELTEDGADEHIDILAQKYLDADEYPHHDEEDASRVIIRIPAERVVTRGRSQDR